MRTLSKYREPLNRPITDHEKQLIHWLLKRAIDGADRFISQVDGLIVTSKCTCGCPTIDFAIEGDGVSQRLPRPISDHLAIVDGQHVGVMLFATESQLSMLEVYSLAGTDKPFGLPEIQALFPWEELRDHSIPPR